jgi:hypothetical protein
MSLHIPADLRRQVQAQFANCCAYCCTAEHLTAVTFEVEHIVPLASGGQTALTNLCYSCPTCNRHKATRQTAVDPQTNTIASIFHPQQQTWSDHFLWNAAQTEIIGLTSTGRATITALHMNRPQLVRVRRMWVILGEHPPKEMG